MSGTRQLRKSKRRRGPLQTITTVAAPKPPQPVNTQGFSCLPDELYLEIISYFPAFTIPNTHRQTDIDVYGHRRLVLDALSQTCQSLRRVFLRYRWQRIEVYQGMDLGKGPLPEVRYEKGKAKTNMKKYAVELLRQLETVTIREPALAELVNVMDIIVVDYSPEPVLEELARCMALMPDLHTVQIHFDLYENFEGKSFIEKQFEPYTFPQIRAAHLSENGYYLFQRCPALNAVSGLKPLIYGKDDYPTSWTSHGILKSIPAPSLHSSITSLSLILLYVERGWFSTARQTLDLASYIRLFISMVNLRDITFQLSHPPTSANMEDLQKNTSLQTIRLIFEYVVHRSASLTFEQWKEMVETFMTSTSAGKNRKKLTMEIF